MKNVALYNLGCKVNSYEVDVMQQNLQANGFLIVPFDEIADIYIINTCTITNTADLKSRKIIRRARHKNPQAIIVAVGCLVQVDEESLKEISIDLAIGNNRKNDLIPLLNEYIGNRQGSNRKAVIDLDNEIAYEEMALKEVKEHTRAFVKIQDGCNQFCSYCIIPYARGRARSREAEAVISELTELVNKGCREVVLTGINLSSYGNGADDLLNLIEKAAEITELSRIRLGSLEPGIISDEFVKRIVSLEKVCPHFHLSLQSGCDTTLKRMNRHYQTADYYEKVKKIRSAYKEKYGEDYQPAITTDIIVGFPGETEAEFIETENFIRQVSFYEMHVFPYSKRKGTAAAIMPEQVTAKVKKERSNRLIMLDKLMSDEYRNAFIGRNVSVIPEDMKVIADKKYWFGYTAEYIRTAILDNKSDNQVFHSGMLVNTKISGHLTEGVMTCF
ncbi:MAG: tRNA (N(6)-L-threonylcarbamoyladenosine(37)-C(2))-methylthiotransferase MtaB [Lachnospiraceae bacterium]|nr:tRNA (N(6)-L-threonylcarbamoyladenosine(37)-C(2))-methylthiotransferase MtaB [Lachnospiraceae bacterium]